ncbi:CPBP family intramembrane glutamic endopeptidase [Nocardioides sp. YIM 152315]|uniref:CPBP family intramembrane glutamic endopeptidase n=1 Tax=Nocardioides sp. YIM 152315 TaxID=3031760 RepID=UPI0023DB0C4A|nr:CPBP family intramembrane glutamic endopeptidase [Nocardioides sp. YIM 152315]MDF1602877.1 CPBP family intramembrane metalloprotease [Nocardioides sp. YIM 152315]
MTDPPGLPYHLVQRGGRPGAWRPIVGVLALVACFIVVVPVLVQVPFAIGLALAGRDVTDGLTRLLDLDDPTPLGLAYLNVTLACAILVTWLLTRVLHRLAPRWLASVAPRIRWRWMAVCFGLSIVALVATLVVSAVVPSSGGGAEISGELNEFTSTTRAFVLVVVFLTPLQAAGEEYAFRGYLTQAFGNVFGKPWAAVLFPALLFALAHGAQSAPIFLDRFAFGVVAGLAVVLTGGLEAGIAMHVLNNWLAFGIALAFSDMASTLNPTGGDWWTIPVTLTQSLVYLGLVVWVARRMRVRETTQTPAEPGVLVGRTGLV